VTRGAFWLGDGPGVGKSRVLAAVAMQHGATRVLWVTASAALRAPARREVEAVWGADAVATNWPVDQSSGGAGGAIGAGAGGATGAGATGAEADGLRLITYAQLVGGRAAEATAWLGGAQGTGGAGGGLLLLDECHRLRRPRTAASRAVAGLRGRLTGLHVLFCSATLGSAPGLRVFELSGLHRACGLNERALLCH